MSIVPTTHRLLYDIRLQSTAGSRFQPTGFPDLGHAVFDRPVSDGGWVKALLVESPQSMANHLEGTLWDDATREPIELIKGLPYVRVVDAASSYLTSSRTEAHRLASAFVKQSSFEGQYMTEVLRDRLALGDDKPLDQPGIARAVMALDPLCLVHGVFFAEDKTVWPGQPKIKRALSAFVEAIDVRRADYGGVKKDDVRHGIGEQAGGTDVGYGTIPYHRTDWTAREITASFSLDRAAIRSYGLGSNGSSLLEVIALLEIRTLIDEGMRLRTACDLIAITDPIVDQGGSELPSRADLEGALSDSIRACDGFFAPPNPMVVTWSGGKSKKRKGTQE